MTGEADSAMWKMLGELLERRRVEIDTRYSNLTLFTTERGLDYRLAWDLEHGARSNYRRPTLTAIEVGYGLVPGSIARFLSGEVSGLARAATRPDDDDGRPRFADPDEQAVADRAWQSTAGQDLGARLGSVGLAVSMHRRQRGRNGAEGRRRHA